MTIVDYKTFNDLIPVSYETYEKLCLFHEILVKWQKRINLISQNSIHEIWTRHILDSVQIKNHIGAFSCEILDIGSGAGFPGIILSIVGFENITLIESDTKKSIFLKEAIRVIGSKASVINDRVENLHDKKYDVITSRAVADLDQLIALSHPHLKENGYCLFPKGRNYTMELEKAKKHWDVSCEINPSIIDKQGVILKIFSISEKIGAP